MTGRQRLGRDPTLDASWQAQQAQRVGDDGSTATQTGRQLVLGDAKVDQELLVGGSLLEWVQVLPVDVLQERVSKQMVVLGGAHDRWDALETRRPRGADASLPHDDLKPITAWTHHDRLEHADGLDARRQVLQWRFVEGSPRLPRVGVDAIQRKLVEGRPGWLVGPRLGHGLLLGRLCRGLAVVLWAAWDQGFQTTAEAATASHQLAPSPVCASKPLRSASSKVRSR